MTALLFVALGALASEPAPVDLFGDAGTDAPAPEPDVPAPPTGTPPMGQVPDAVLEAAVASRNLPLAERMMAISEPLLEKPYVADPLGEGTGHDADPLARYDAFDCLTWVEEVVALSLAGDPVHAAPIRLGLRYDGDEPSYDTRQHFMELQWIPHAEAQGWLRDTTAEYGAVETYQRDVTLGLFRAWSRRHLFALADEKLPVGEMRQDFLPMELAAEVAPDIRPGSIVMALREDRSWVPLWITHLGFTVPGDDEPLLRHASRMKASQRTRDHRLSWYVEHLGTYKNWKSAGIAVFEPVEFGPRLSLLPPAEIPGE